MFGSIGMPELLVIFVIALLIFGPSKVPDIGRSLGEAIRGFKKAMSGSEKPQIKEPKDQTKKPD